VSGSGVHFGVGVHTGVHLTHGLPQVSVIDGVVPLEHRQGFMPRYGHNAEVVNPGSPGVGHKRMSKIMKHGVLTPAFWHAR
jgi:hypothetical protein